MKYEYWGHHLMLDCRAGDLKLVRDGENIKQFAEDLVNKIEMTAYGDPIVEHFATHNPEAAGYSLLQLIETSNIAGHFVDINGDFYLDIFSCKEFDIEVAKKVVEQWFNPENIKVSYFTRQA